ncbi:putative tail assembly chaperone [Vibrio phage pVco-14]|nr:putative tail assembly chaperone [Vibrio phage pVco-14]
MQEFFTRQKANEGNKVPLYLPNGEPSEHWIQVRGVDSDQFKTAENAAKRKAVEIAQIEEVQERAKVVRETELECVAALVADWSFDEECTPENVVNFLREAPQIADMINRYAANRKSFFA